jgi:hypothetical protein
MVQLEDFLKFLDNTYYSIYLLQHPGRESAGAGERTDVSRSGQPEDPLTLWQPDQVSHPP